MMPTVSTLAGAVLLFGLTGEGHSAGGTCELATAAERVPAAARALTGWEASNKIRLALAARQSTLVELCLAVESAIALPGVTAAKLADASEQAVRDYLDRELNPASQPRSISASLRSALGVSGFSRPGVRKLGRLKVEGAGGAFTIRVEGAAGVEEARAPIELFLAPGKVRVFRLAGGPNGRQACGDPGGVEIGAGAPASVRC